MQVEELRVYIRSSLASLLSATRTRRPRGGRGNMGKFSRLLREGKSGSQDAPVAALLGHLRGYLSYPHGK